MVTNRKQQRQQQQKKDASKTWKVVKTINGEAPTQSGKTLMYQRREYFSDKAKASAFCQE